MKKLAYMLKSSKVLYNLYYYIISFLLRLWGKFLPIDNKLILFNSFGGKKYDDSSKAIYEAMKKDPRFCGFRLVWALQNPEKVQVPENTKIIKADTLAYFKTALKAGVWVTNSSIERGLNFKKKNTLCFNTWHGTAIKKMGIDISSDNMCFHGKGDMKADIMLAQGQYDIDVFSHAYGLPKENFRCIGLPRNDVLANYTQKEAAGIRKKLNIPPDKKVILYAPTFREYEKGQDRQCVLKIPMDLSYWQEQLGQEYVVLFRAHYEVAEHMNVSQYPLFLDVSFYPTLTDLMIVSDMLITDYSSICFDYSIMPKPILCYAYDYDKYTEKRGMYLSLKDVMPCEIAKDERELIRQIKELDVGCMIKRTEKFRNTYVTAYGNAARKSCDILAEQLNLC